jgi:hypothetical protein
MMDTIKNVGKVGSVCKYTILNYTASVLMQRHPFDCLFRTSTSVLCNDKAICVTTGLSFVQGNVEDDTKGRRRANTLTFI